jgi:signal transduction histidine kinase
MNDIGYKQIRHAKSTELQPISRLQDIEAHDASHSQHPRVQSVSESMSVMDWLSTSIVHDLRNPVATIYAGTEVLMNVDPTPTEVKRLTANMYRAADRMRELLGSQLHDLWKEINRGELRDPRTHPCRPGGSIRSHGKS